MSWMAIAAEISPVGVCLNFARGIPAISDIVHSSEVHPDFGVGKNMILLSGKTTTLVRECRVSRSLAGLGVLTITPKSTGFRPQQHG